MIYSKNLIAIGRIHREKCEMLIFHQSEMANIGLFLLHAPRQLYAGLSAATSW